MTYIYLQIAVLFNFNGLQRRSVVSVGLCRLKCTFGSNLQNIQIAYRASVYVDREKLNG